MGCEEVQPYLMVLGREHKMGREIIVLGANAGTRLLLFLV